METSEPKGTIHKHGSRLICVWKVWQGDGTSVVLYSATSPCVVMAKLSEESRFRIIRHQVISIVYSFHPIESVPCFTLLTPMTLSNTSGLRAPCCEEMDIERIGNSIDFLEDRTSDEPFIISQ